MRSFKQNTYGCSPAHDFGYLSASTTHPLYFFAKKAAFLPKPECDSENFLRPSFNVTTPLISIMVNTVLDVRLLRFLASRSRFPICFLILFLQIAALSLLLTFDPRCAITKQIYKP